MKLIYKSLKYSLISYNIEVFSEQMFKIHAAIYINIP